MKEVREKFNESRYRFSKLKIKEIRENLYKIVKEKDLSFKKNLTELEENLLKSKKYYEYDSEYRGIRNVRDLFDLSIDENYYEPILVKSGFSGNYIQYESRGDKGKNLSIKRYLKMIRPYLSDLINKDRTHGLARYHAGNKSWIGKTSSEWKIQITMAINFISSKDSDETRTMHTKSNNAEIMVSSETNEIIKDLFESFLQKYQEGLEESMRGSEFVYDDVDVLYYNLNKVSLRDRSYIHSPKWLKNKKATINPQNKKDDRCFQYAVTVALNYE